MDQTLWQMAQPIIAGQLRHFLTGIAGALIAKGALQSDQQGAFVTITMGIWAYLVGTAWSWWQKKGQEALVAELASLKAKVSGSAPIKAAMDQKTGAK